MNLPRFTAEASLSRTSGEYRVGRRAGDVALLAGADLAMGSAAGRAIRAATLDFTSGTERPVPSGGCSGGGCHCHGVLSCGQLFHLCCNWFVPPACVHDGSFDGLHCVCKSNGMCGDFGPSTALGLTGTL
jgi:hypothetical protein